MQTNPAFSSSSTPATFDSMVMAFLSRGWKVTMQLTDSVVLKKTVGVNGWAASIIMLLFSLVGMLVVIVWIAVAGSTTFTLQRTNGDSLANVTGKNISTRVNSPLELEPLFTTVGSGFKVGYVPAIAIGIVCFFINTLLFQALL